MENLSIDSLSLQEESDKHTVKAPLVGRDYAGRTYQKEESDDQLKVSSGDQVKPKSSFRARFGSKSTHEESSDLLDRGIVPRSSPEKASNKPSFQNAMKKINEDVVSKDRDKALGQLFTQFVNPKKFLMDIVRNAPLILIFILLGESSKKLTLQVVKVLRNLVIGFM